MPTYQVTCGNIRKKIQAENMKPLEIAAKALRKDRDSIKGIIIVDGSTWAQNPPPDYDPVKHGVIIEAGVLLEYLDDTKPNLGIVGTDD